MHIKQLEISGFKSFVDRSVIHFDHDVIGIVGPNGCGKSNIVDAIRWCMGEQSAKHLRGKAMQDVIFSGSESRGPHGMAEVTITFDNTDGEAALTLPIEYRDYAEIAVTRRLYRDGTSEYLVNKTQVRLKDITDLFLGTGVGTKAYSIVEQGKIGLIVSARAEDRRMLIEEAAGITKYKHRRKQAEQKMDLTRQNLARVGDIVAEIDRGLASLKRQAQKAERYKAYRAELEDLMLHEASHRWLELTVVGRVEMDALADVTERLDRSLTEQFGREAQLESARQATYELEAKTEAASAEAYAAGNEVKRLEAEIIRSKDKLVVVKTHAEKADAEQKELGNQAETLGAERELLREKLAELEEREDTEKSIALETHEQLEALRSEQQLADRQLGELRARASSAASKVAAADAKLDGFARRMAEMQSRREKLSFDADGQRAERQELDSRRTQLAEQLAELSEARRQSAEDKTAFETESKELRERLVASEREFDVARNELSQRRNRLRALEEVQRRMEGVGVGAKNLLATKAPCLQGLVADRIAAPKELTTALASVLGDRLEAVVVTDFAEGLALLRDLAAAKKGRASIVLATPSKAAPTFAPVTGEGILGRLADLITHAPEDAGLVRNLVGGTLVVETIDRALELAGEHPNDAIVSLDGNVLHPDGRITGGAGDAAAAGILDSQREMRELADIVAELTTRVESLTEAHEALKARTQEVGAALDKARQDAHQHEIAHVAAEKDLRRAEDQFTNAIRRIESIAGDVQDIEDKLADAADEESDARAALESGEAELNEAKEALEGAEMIAADWRERVSAQQSVVTEYKVRLAQIHEQTQGTRTTVDRLSRSIDELSTRGERLEAELMEGAIAWGRLGATIMNALEQSSGAVEAAQRADQILSEQRRLFEDAKLDLQTREGDLKSLRSSVTSLSEAKQKHEMQAARLAYDQQHLLEGVAEKFRGLDLRRVLGDYHKRGLVDDAHRARITELAGLLDRIGPVNLDAVQELATEEKRHEFFDSQKKDLEAALGDLEKAIAEMDRESKKLFRETFDAVNTYFQELFPRMFRGGIAKLQLTNPDDMLETGIEILAQPPGKKLGNIELMSGGEKALTAVSLIFAMFRHKPSPFCILDEVDAPLDEANVTRYNEAIRSMTSKSQFILITHIKRTMQSVDVLYGVTMQEPGVSKLVSVKVNENATKRSQLSTINVEGATGKAGGGEAVA
jgi:chromosome segregation protein